jgi:hypothetical protein
LKLTFIEGSPIPSLCVFCTIVCIRVKWLYAKEHEAHHVKGNVDMMRRDELQKGQITI